MKRVTGSMFIPNSFEVVCSFQEDVFLFVMFSWCSYLLYQSPLLVDCLLLVLHFSNVNSFFIIMQYVGYSPFYKIRNIYNIILINYSYLYKTINTRLNMLRSFNFIYLFSKLLSIFENYYMPIILEWVIYLYI